MWENGFNQRGRSVERRSPWKKTGVKIKGDKERVKRERRTEGKGAAEKNNPI